MTEDKSRRVYRDPCSRRYEVALQLKNAGWRFLHVNDDGDLVFTQTVDGKMFVAEVHEMESPQ